MSFGKELIKSANEALSIAKGDVEPAGVYVPETVDVAAIRKKQKLSQAAFADRYGLSVGTVRDWEQARRSPDRCRQPDLGVDDPSAAADERRVRQLPLAASLRVQAGDEDVVELIEGVQRVGGDREAR